MSDPRVSIIIASYNGLEHLQLCLPSVSRSQYPGFEIVVCDDCSTDGTLAYLRDYARREPRLKIVENARNLGASATRNQAVRHADGAILVLLDNDTEVEPDWLRELVAVMESAPGVGAAQAALVVFESRDQIQLTGAELLPQACWGIPLEQGLNPAERSLRPREIIALSTATAVRRDVFERVGGFDEKLAVYTEDLEFSWRVWIAGWRILSAPRAVVYHRGAKDRAGMGGTLRHIYFNMGKNTLRSLTKNHGGWRVWRYLPVAMLTLAGRAVFRLFLGDTGCFCATARAFGWYFATLPDTLRERRFVQRELRRRSDREIAAAVFSKKSWCGMIAHYVRCNYLRQ